jgi:hypothetical protein
MTRGKFTDDQVKQLLEPINPLRVLQVQGHSHVSQQDITAHLIRILGFGNFDIEVLETALLFEDQRANDKGELLPKWDVCYRAMVRITVFDPSGEQVAHYENGSTATAQNQSRGDGHDLAYKSAISLSIKRAAIALGDQFGLSLYNRGQLTALVKGTLVGGPVLPGDVQMGVEQQVSLGNDEVDSSPRQAAEEVRNRTVEPADASVPPEGWRGKVIAAKSLVELSEIHQQAIEGGWATPELMAALTARKAQL